MPIKISQLLLDKLVAENPLLYKLSRKFKMLDRLINFLKILTVAGLILPYPISAATFFKDAAITLESVKSNDYIYYQTQDGFQIIATNNQKQVVDWKNAFAHSFVGKPNAFKLPDTAISLSNNGIRVFAHDSALLFREHQRSTEKIIHYKKELHDYRIATSHYAGHAAHKDRIFQWPYNESMRDNQTTLERKLKSVFIPVLSCIPLMLTGFVFLLAYCIVETVIEFLLAKNHIH